MPTSWLSNRKGDLEHNPLKFSPVVALPSPLSWKSKWKLETQCKVYSWDKAHIQPKLSYSNKKQRDILLSYLNGAEEELWEEIRIPKYFWRLLMKVIRHQVICSKRLVLMTLHLQIPEINILLSSYSTLLKAGTYQVKNHLYLHVDIK